MNKKFELMLTGGENSVKQTFAQNLKECIKWYFEIVISPMVVIFSGSERDNKFVEKIQDELLKAGIYCIYNIKKCPCLCRGIFV